MNRLVSLDVTEEVGMRFQFEPEAVRGIRRQLAFVALLALMATGCGLKADLVIDPQGRMAASDLDDQTGATGPADGDLDGDAADAADDAGEAAAGAAASGDGEAADAAPAGEAAAAAASGMFPRETEGITRNEIRLCAHVPITGAAPIPHHPDRFGQFYFNYVNKELGGIHGRQVRFVAINDQYYPAGARRAAEECARKGAFVYFGAAGTDQIVSVARWAEERQIPYFHGPASIRDLNDLKYNAHVGPYYEYQHELLADYLVERFGKDKVHGMIRVDSPFFEAARDAYAKALARHGIELAVDRTVQKDENTFADVYFALRSEGVEIVNNFTTPNIWIKMLRQRPANYDPVWTAVSPVAGFNIVSDALAGSGQAVVFHHFNPSCECTDFRAVPNDLPYRDDIDEFLRIFRAYSPEKDPPPDDFDYASYLGAKQLHRILEQVGPEPTRSKVFELLNSYKEDPQDVFPACGADFTRTQDERIGAWKLNVFELDGNVWRQAQTCADRPSS